MYSFKKEGSWREYQDDFIAKKRKKGLIRASSRIISLLAVSSVLILCGTWIFTRHLTDYPQNRSAMTEPGIQESVQQLTLPGVKNLIRNVEFLNADKDQFLVDTPEETYTVHTQLDVRLQKELDSVIDHLLTLDRGKPQRIAMVAMDAASGMIKAMAGFDLDDPSANPCTASDYPAASIIKLITASAAVDSLGYNDQTPLYFNGQKYTLYKRQLKSKENQYTTRVTLGLAFAESINPVFGKLGKNLLGREVLGNYATAFGFNHEPDSDLPIDPSHFATTDNEYHLAELGCGFNHDTKISPVFGAQLVATILNGGRVPEPRIVDRIELSDGRLVYESDAAFYQSPIKESTADTMEKIMQMTVKRGTARRAFRGYRRDKILSKLTIGGKTGSLYSSDRTVKYDWFIGFGKEKETGKNLVVSVVVGHRKYIGTRAGTHARNMLKTFFHPRPKQKDSSASG